MVKILWVDDEVELLKPHVLFLQQKGYEVDTCNNGYDAIDMASEGAYDLIILDEFGYAPVRLDGARLLYQIIAGSYERRSIIFTTNIEFSKWGTIFADDKLAAAIINRIVHHGRLIEFTGPSRRVSQALMFGKTDNQ